MSYVEKGQRPFPVISKTFKDTVQKNKVQNIPLQQRLHYIPKHTTHTHIYIRKGVAVALNI